MRITAMLSSKGQVTIPIVVRDFLEIDTGDKVEFEIDRENRYVRLYSSSTEHNCLVCDGIGTLNQSKSKCFFCFGTGKVPSDIKLMTRAVQWRLQDDIEVNPSVLFDETFTQGLYVPIIEVTHPVYATTDLQRANEAALIYQFIQCVAGERNTLEQEEFAYLEHLLASSPLKSELSRIFRVEGAAND